MVAWVESCSSSSGTDSSLSDSVPDPVSAWGCGNSCSVAGTVSVASPGILCGEPVLIFKIASIYWVHIMYLEMCYVCMRFSGVL